jgi:broad specificity phosphatase PhoE
MLIIVRHGRTAANAAGELLGRRDLALDVTGQAQARALAAAVGPVSRVVCSPLLRARETAAAFDMPVEVDDRWLELDYGEWDGATSADLGPERWAAWRADLDFCPPGGESLRALGVRVRQACDDLVAAADREDIVVVTHVSPIKAAFGWALGVGDEVSWRCYVAPASIMRVAVSRFGSSLWSFNETAHLPSGAPR